MSLIGAVFSPICRRHSFGPVKPWRRSERQLPLGIPGGPLPDSAGFLRDLAQRHTISGSQTLLLSICLSMLGLCVACPGRPQLLCYTLVGYAMAEGDVNGSQAESVTAFRSSSVEMCGNAALSVYRKAAKSMTCNSNWVRSFILDSGRGHGEGRLRNCAPKFGAYRSSSPMPRTFSRPVELVVTTRVPPDVARPGRAIMYDIILRVLALHG